MKIISALLLLTFALFNTVVPGADSAETVSRNLSATVRCDRYTSQFVPRIPPKIVVHKAAGHYTPEDWRTAIDNTWDSPYSREMMSFIYESFATRIDEEFACFRNIDINWDSITAGNLSEIEQSSVSRGRFAAMLGYAARSLQEGHTVAIDSIVRYTSLEPGVPLLVDGGWGVNDHFGAGLTPLEDSSLLVYSVVDNHPLGLAVGDVVLGYDGIPWTALHRDLLQAGLPLTGIGWGSSKSSFTHSWLMAAGLNWHLFDTIDVVKYGNSDTVHLATELLDDAQMTHYATEQISIPGVSIPNPPSLIEWGIVTGTTVGYVYAQGWLSEKDEDDWSMALASFDLNDQISGLIIDLRTCFGGNVFYATPGLEFLFEEPVDEIGASMRDDPTDHYSMQPSYKFSDEWLQLHPYPGFFFDKPIAVLIGPGCFSMGDFTALLLSFHPRTKFFGKPTGAAFNGPEIFYPVHDIYVRYACSETYLKDSPELFLTHREFPNPVDFPWVQFEEVWLTPDNVVQGKDDVVMAALDWISVATDVDNDARQPIADYRLLQNAPNPFNPATTISYVVPKRTRVSLEIFDILGRKVRTLIEEKVGPGKHSVVWDGRDDASSFVASGIYFSRLRAGNFQDSRKMILLR